MNKLRISLLTLSIKSNLLKLLKIAMLLGIGLSLMTVLVTLIVLFVAYAPIWLIISVGSLLTLLLIAL